MLFVLLYYTNAPILPAQDYESYNMNFPSMCYLCTVKCHRYMVFKRPQISLVYDSMGLGRRRTLDGSQKSGRIVVILGSIVDIRRILFQQASYSKNLANFSLQNRVESSCRPGTREARLEKGGVKCGF